MAPTCVLSSSQVRIADFGLEGPGPIQVLLRIGLGRPGQGALVPVPPPHKGEKPGPCDETYGSGGAPRKGPDSGGPYPQVWATPAERPSQLAKVCLGRGKAGPCSRGP